MKTDNSFKRLLEEEEKLYPPPPEIEENILGSLQILNILSRAVELYIPKVFEMFILTLGGTIREIDHVANDGLPLNKSGIHPGDDASEKA